MRKPESHAGGNPAAGLAAIGVLVAALAGPATARDLTGAFAYRERIALPPDATLVVEATDGLGWPLATLARPTEGAQVPLPFTLDVPPGQDVLVRGGLASGGEIRWLSEPLRVPSGEDAVDLGVIALAPYRVMGFASHYRCGDLAVTAGFRADGAGLRIGARHLALAPVEAASGAKFADPADPETWLWSRGEALTLSLGGTTLPDCAPALPAGVGWRATGNEPAWAISVAGGQLTFLPFGAEATEAALPAPEPQGTGALYRLDAIGFAVTVTPELCRDSMTGMPRPDRVTVAEGDRILTGCGGDPAALLAGPEWRIIELAGSPLPEGIEANLRFSAGGALSGKAACNRLFGGYTLTGEGLSLETGGMSMMACPEPEMAAERAILDALGQIDRFDFDDAGDLLLIGAGTTLLRARF
jgi:heat shock protein HslJ/membrane-bound inhibitor of C-type lysozyme